MDPKQHKDYLDEEILEKFIKNEVRTKELESLKNLLKDARIFNLDESIS
ncbi:hypothetical protein [Ureibacillus sp. FSL K6-2830]